MATVAKKEPHAEETNTRYSAKLYADDYWFNRAALAYVGLVNKQNINAVKREISTCVARGLTDSGITNSIIHKYWNKQPRYDSANRGNRRADEITELLGGLVRVNKYVDFGCGDRTITEAVGRSFGLNREDIYGVDLFDSKSNGSIFIKSTRDLPDNSVDLVTAFVSLHHVIDQEAQIKDFARIIKPSGAIIIREHDLEKDSLMFEYLQLIHIISAVWDTEGALGDILRDVKYRPHYEWNLMFTRAGFDLKTLKRTDPHIQNPQGLYYCLFLPR